MAPLLKTELEKKDQSNNAKDQASRKNQTKKSEEAAKLKEQILNRQQGRENPKENSKADATPNRMEEFFEWKPPPPPETMAQKFSRKVKQNPFVPIGSICTVAALSYGLFSFVRGDKRMQQYMMRARVLAQGGTIIAIIGGLGYMLYHGDDGRNGNKTY